MMTGSANDARHGDASAGPDLIASDGTAEDHTTQPDRTSDSKLASAQTSDLPVPQPTDDTADDHTTQPDRTSDSKLASAQAADLPVPQPTDDTADDHTTQPDRTSDSKLASAQAADLPVPQPTDDTAGPRGATRPNQFTAVFRPLTFGPSARLPQTPLRLARQPDEVFHQVPDIAVDWADLAVGQVRAVSVRGHLHRFLGEIRQDSFAVACPDRFLALAVADGVGNVSASHLGSALTTRLFVRAADMHAQAMDHAALLEQISLESIASELVELGRNQGIEPRELSTTLIAAVVGDQQNEEIPVSLLQIGDSSAWRLADGQWTKLDVLASNTGEEQLISTAVEPLPLHSVARLWRETFRPGETLGLVSDGIGNLLPANSEFAAALATLWSAQAPDPTALLQVVDATVKSFDDDRTLLGIRFGEPRQ